MSYQKKTDYAPHIAPEASVRCEAEGCAEPGMYKAPKSKNRLHDYRWLCLEHVREHNRQWDFFKGFDAAAIEDFIRDAVTGHRPTWSRESRVRQSYHQIQDALYEFLNPGSKAFRAAPAPPKLQKALRTLEMNYPYTARQLKRHYRALVKKHHPDVNRGDKTSEEIFKKITVAYRVLLEHLDSF
ncbi:MAG: DnaJ domain-containing protein [Pseudomonadota bacterium]|nr:DnaJ domain-containing protein [Pseudomonadota bacterium]MDE3037975.1 DnaJ domain-containing protein [Pseudomonadota bacterium]